MLRVIMLSLYFHHTALSKGAISVVSVLLHISEVGHLTYLLVLPHSILASHLDPCILNIAIFKIKNRGNVGSSKH
jgi:hypothetical protein